MVLTLVKINSVDVTSYLVNYEYERTYGDLLSEMNLRFVRGIHSAVTINTGLTLEVWRGYVTSTDTKIFSGYVEKYELEGGLLNVVGIDKLWDLVRKEVTKFYDSTIDASAGKLSAIFQDLVTTYGGLNADSSTVQDSGTVIVLQKFKCNHADPFERCKKLADVLDWQFYYRADTDKVYFEPKGNSINSTVLTVGDNVMQVPKWQYDVTEMTNDVYIIGALQEVEYTQTGQIGVTSGFTTASVSLTYKPESVKVFYDSSNPPTTLQVGGVESSTATFFYSVDKDNKKVLPKSGTSFANPNYLQVNYSTLIPIPVQITDEPSIATYGRFTKTLTYNDILSIADAEQRGSNYLLKYSVPFVYTTMKVKNVSTYNLAVGQKIRVVDDISTPNVDAILLINKVRIRYPSDYDELDVGDKYWRLADFNALVMEKLKRLEEEQSQNTELLNVLSSRINPALMVENRYVSVLTQTVGGTNLFILGHPTYGVLGTSKLGDTDMGAETSNFITQHNNTYDETFYDNDFKDATGTATWNTGTNQLTFTSGQVGKSLSIDYANGTITAATMTATISSGTFTLALTANGGSNWETVTNGSAHTFSATGTDLRWRITESGASTGTITRVQVTDYH